MRKAQFDTRSDDGTVKTRTGYLFDWSDIPGYHFAIYRASNNINSSKRWIVIELSTGLAIGGNNWQNGQTRKQAIIEAKEILLRVGKIGLDNRIQEVINGRAVSGKLNEKIAS